VCAEKVDVSGRDVASIPFQAQGYNRMGNLGLAYTIFGTQDQQLKTLKKKTN
jgi:hypothetical protein